MFNEFSENSLIFGVSAYIKMTLKTSQPSQIEYGEVNESALFVQTKI